MPGDRTGNEVAIVGMAGRFPGAASPELLWPVVREGRVTIRRIEEPECAVEGLHGREDYVPFSGVLDGVDQFDADFFGIAPAQALAIDPQHRLLLECCWHALEDGGCVPSRFPGAIGVFAGVGTSEHPRAHASRPRLDSPEDIAASIAADKDFAATRVAHRLDLRGPAITVQTACSTSLVAVHLAMRSLRARDCDAVLAGGITVRLPQPVGYLHQPGSIGSPDGRCLPFSADAQGMVPGSGGGVVLLKRLEDALAAADRVHAVILGSAVNNDGGMKLSYTAPSVAGQAAVIRSAMAEAGVAPATVGYVEAHGTGTALGDAMEVAGLRAVFGNGPEQTCVLGSVKANLGHLDVGSGVTGLIKAVLVLRNGVLPPSPYARHVNPDLDLTASPFRLPTEAEPWAGLRRAAVSSFGIGGTNAHVVLEQAPPPKAGARLRSAHPLLLSARSEDALVRQASALGAVVGELPLERVSSTLLTGRAEFAHRWSVVVETAAQASAALRGVAANPQAPAPVPARPRTCAFLLPGFGARGHGLTAEVYADEPVFRAAIDRCADALAADGGPDLRVLLHSADRPADDAERAGAAMPAVFALEYALGELLASWGVRPVALLGHSLGEWSAACLAKTVSPEDGVRVAAARGRLTEALPEGGMLAVAAAAADLGRSLPGALTVAADIGPRECLVSGRPDDLDAFAARLTEGSVDWRRLPVDRAMHSPDLDPVLDRYRDVVRGVRLATPQLPWLSNLTGTWITPEQAVDPDYWVRQLRQPCLVSDAFAALARTAPGLLVEVGPGNGMGARARRHPATAPDTECVALLPKPRSGTRGYRDLLTAVGRLWCAGGPVDITALAKEHRHPLVTLPPYPFEPVRPPDTGPAVPARAAHRAEQGSHQDPLSDAWAEVLGVGRVAEDDDFFELGGDSLAALQLSAHLRTRLGSMTTPADLLAAPTLRRFRAHLAARTPATGLDPITVVTSPALPPLYLVHPIGGTTVGFRDLATCLAETCSVSGFTARGLLPGDGGPRDRVDDIASAYTAALLAAHSEGAYWLGGVSFGGVVAHDMAWRLARSGRPPMLTVLLDSPWPENVPQNPTDTDIARDLGPDAAPAAGAVYRAHHRALRTHVVRTADQSPPVLYVRAADEHHADDRSWKAALDTVRIAESPGNHHSMLRPPHVRELASLLTHQAHAATTGPTEDS